METQLCFAPPILLKLRLWLVVGRRPLRIPPDWSGCHGLTRERVRQVEAKVLRKIARRGAT